MTQELIANMLGVRREGVTESAIKLQKLGLISDSRGHITVLDSKGLERLSCECYAVVCTGCAGRPWCERETRLMVSPSGDGGRGTTSQGGLTLVLRVQSMNLRAASMC